MNHEEFAKLTNLVEQAKTAAEAGLSKPSIRSQVIEKLKSALDLAAYEAGDKGRLKVGKSLKKSDISSSNVLEGMRRRSNEKVDSMPSLSSAARSNLSAPLPKKKGWGGRTKIGKGDVVSVPATIFDGDDPGSYSNEFPDRCFGTVESVSKKGIVIVNWSDGDVHGVKLKDCKKEQHKLTVASIILLLIEGEQVAFKSVMRKQTQRTSSSCWSKQIGESGLRL